MLTFYDGHLVLAQAKSGVLICIVPTDDGLRKLATHVGLEQSLADTSICGKSFQKQVDYLGTLYLCPADSKDQVEMELEMKNLQKSLADRFGFQLRLIDKRYCRPVSWPKAA